MTAFQKLDLGPQEEGIDLGALRANPWRDFSGRRVVADFEGPGLLLGLRALGIQAFADGVAAQAGVVAFSYHLSLASEVEAKLEGCVLLGRTEAPSGRVEEVGLPFEGSGYLVASDGPVARDGRTEALAVSSGCAIPFFEGIGGVGTASVMNLGRGRLQEVACLSLANPATLEAARWKVKSMSDLDVLDSRFDCGVGHTGVVASHMNTAEFRVDLPTGSVGVRLRKLYDRFHGKQRARVLAGGRQVGTWYIAEEDRHARWAESEFGFGLEEPWSGGWMELAIDPPPGTPLWSFSEMKMFAVSA